MFSLVISFIHTSIYICQSLSPSSSHPVFPPWYPYIVLYICVYFCFAVQFIWIIFLDSTYNWYYICFSFWLTSLWQSLGLFTSLQMAHFYDWVIFCFIYVSHLLYPLLWWPFRLLLCLAIIHSAVMNIGVTCVFWNYAFLWVYGPEVGLLGHMAVLFLVF